MSPATNDCPWCWSPAIDLARVHAGARDDRHAPRALELLVQRLQALPHLQRGADGAQGVVLVQLRDAEDGHHRIADELLDHAAVTLDDDLHLVEVPGDEPAQRLRVELLPEAHRVGYVGEEHGHDLPHLGIRLRRRRQRCAAGAAEPQLRLVWRAARVADQVKAFHATTLGRHAAGAQARSIVGSTGAKPQAGA